MSSKGVERELNSNKVANIFNKIVKSKQIYESVLLVESESGEVIYKGEYGGKSIDSPLLMASITKLFTSASVLILAEQGKLSLDDQLTKYFDAESLKGLHLHRGQDSSTNLKISSLLFQTSGLPDVFEEGKNRLKMRAIQQDLTYSFDDVVSLTKQMRPHFAPDSTKRAHYADINFDLLGEIIERVTETPLHQAYDTLLFQPLGLSKTYLPISDEDFIPDVYYKENAIHRPKYIQCCRASGGAISTARELMIFLKAFFGGTLFNKDIFNRLSTYNKLQLTMTPLQYGGGYMRIPANGPFTLFMGKGELLGHSGSTGSFAYYYPEKKLFLVGDINQIAKPALPVKLMLQIITTIK